ncbi:TlpA family protein disulfide reductase [Streptomyces cinerochromogenes]|uniref:TlpA family protein disulfide reductase n=1 Tax=Streptomyces cinerochromogenes TaxID=66422 RepID=A0ABW7BJA7_9ACTN
MPVLFGLVALVGVVCALDLVLTVGVIERLVEQSEKCARPGRAPATSVAEGDRVDAFRTVTTDGRPLHRDQLPDDTAVAFFAPDCRVCRETLPEFLEYARALPGGRRQALAVVVGEEEAAAVYAARLAPVAQVVVEERGGPVSLAFAVTGFPSLLRVARDRSGTLVTTPGGPDLGRPGTPTSRAA